MVAQKQSDPAAGREPTTSTQEKTRKPWIKKTTIQKFIEEIEKKEKEIAEKEEQIKKDRKELEKLKEAKKVLEAK
jgi:hypothetical protein